MIRTLLIVVGVLMFTTTAIAADEVAKVESVMPKSARKDRKLEKQVAKLLEAKWRSDKVLKVVIVDKRWTTEFVTLKGRDIPQRRKINTIVAVSQPGGQCRTFEVSFVQPAKGMRKFGPTEYNAVGGSKKVDCAAIK